MSKLLVVSFSARKYKNACSTVAELGKIKTYRDLQMWSFLQRKYSTAPIKARKKTTARIIAIISATVSGGGGGGGGCNFKNNNKIK